MFQNNGTITNYFTIFYIEEANFYQFSFELITDITFFTYKLKRMIRCFKNRGTFASFYISLTGFKLLTDHSPQSTMAHGLVKHLYLLKYHNICGYKNCSSFFFLVTDSFFCFDSQIPSISCRGKEPRDSNSKQHLKSHVNLYFFVGRDLYDCPVNTILAESNDSLFYAKIRVYSSLEPYLFDLRPKVSVLAN